MFAVVAVVASGLEIPALTARRFVLARHGETNFNAEGRIQGTLDSSMLTERGIAQASGLGYGIAAREAAGIAAVWVSPMRRARQTLAAVAGACDAAGVPLPAARTRDDLREIELHHWEGRLKAEIAVEEADGWRTWRTDPASYATPSGRTPLPDLWRRAVGNWAALREDAPPDGTTLIVSHGAVGRCMVAAALGAGVDSFRDDRFAFDNCEAVEVAWDPAEAVASHWRRVHPAPATPWETAASATGAPPARVIEEPQLMRAVFADGTTAARVVALIEAFPLQGLSGAPTAETVEDGVRILFRRSRIEASGTLAAAAAVVDDGTLLPDGGLFFRVVPTDDGTAVALVASRIAAGIEDMPKVIREKQVCKKMLAKIKESVDCKSAGFRPVGSGSF